MVDIHWSETIDCIPIQNERPGTATVRFIKQISGFSGEGPSIVVCLVWLYSTVVITGQVNPGGNALLPLSAKALLGEFDWAVQAVTMLATTPNMAQRCKMPIDPNPRQFHDKM